MSSCTLFKALGLVNTCGDESPPLPEEEPIDANIRIGAAIKLAEESALEHLKAHQEADLLSKDRTRSNDASQDAANNMVKSGLKAHTDETAAAVAKSKALNRERLTSLTSPNGEYTAYVKLQGSKGVLTIVPTTSDYTAARGGHFTFYNNGSLSVSVAPEISGGVPNNLDVKAWRNKPGIQLTDEGKLVALN